MPRLVSGTANNIGSKTNLPLVQLVLFRLVLLHEIIKNFAESFLIRLQCWDDVLDSSLHQDTVNQAKALSIF